MIVLVVFKAIINALKLLQDIGGLHPRQCNHV